MIKIMKEDEKFYFIDFLRAIACALITNSHLDGVYPIDISWGGCPGNSLFFLITGFLLAGKKLSNVRFSEWYMKKLVRLYLPLIIVDIVMVAIGFREFCISLFLFPVKQFWFIPSIIALYAIYYLAIKFSKKLFFIIDVIFYLFCYFVVFDRKDFFVEKHFYFLIMYGFVAMLLGTFLRERMDQIVCSKKKIPIIYFGVSILFVVSFLIMKLWIATGSVVALQLQFLTQFFSLGFAFFLFLATINFKDDISSFGSTLSGRIIQWIGVSTLEIYLVQFVFIFYLKNILFPFNLLLICLSVIISGIVLHMICGRIYSCFKVSRK